MRVFKKRSVNHLEEENKRLTEKLIELESAYDAVSKRSYERLSDAEFWKKLAIKYRDERNTQCTCK